MGKIVNIPLKSHIRSYVDIFDKNESTEFVAASTAFYDGLTKVITENRHTMDIWSYGLDQFGLMEMKNMVNSSGGMLAMH